MSSGDQMKIPVKNAEERNIPWSQQVDEASYENLASPTTHDDNPGTHQSSTQFQYPPFNAKENQNISWNNFKSRKPNNFEANKKYGKPAFYNNSKREEGQPNAWGVHNTRRNITDGSSVNYNRSTRSDDNYPGNGKLDNRQGTNITSDDKKPTATVAPKKTTWASIASQPAKLTSRTTLTTSSHKKKGPGMPPPPMVPGKHNLDVNTWDLPNNNPPPVPSPPPPIDITPGLNADFPMGIMATTDQDIGSRQLDRGQPGMGGSGNGGGGCYDSSKDDSKPMFNNSNNYGRTRNSPNGPTRKNWSTQHPLNQNRQTNVVPGGPTRRIDGGGGGGGGGSSNNFGQNHRYVSERRSGHYSSSRQEFDNNSSFDFRDENSPRNAERAPNTNTTTTTTTTEAHVESPQAVLDELRDKNNYNPIEIDLDIAATARFFVIKSYSEDDIHRSIKYEIWCSTDHGNKRLDDAFNERQKEGGNILLFFSVNGSGHFCGMAQMMTAVDYNSTSSVWSQDKWKGKFKVKWIYVKDVPNSKLRHIHLENNDNKSVTHSRDTQEVPNAQGIEVLQIMHSFKHLTSIFDDFSHYEERQKEEVSSKKPSTYHSSVTQSPGGGRHYNRQGDDRDGRSNNSAQKYFGGSGGGGTSFRDRNTRSNYHSNNSNYNEHRRFENHRSTGNSDYQQQQHLQQQKERDVNNTERDAPDYGSRHGQKFDYNRRDDRTLSKINNRERGSEFSDDHSNKGETRFRSGPREPQKDNEHAIAERARSGSDY